MSSAESNKTHSLDSLRVAADTYYGEECFIYHWLMAEGFVPLDHQVTRKSTVRLGGPGDKIETDYLAATALEWDRWGRPLPYEFVRMLDAEYGQKFENVSSILRELGRD